VVPPLLPYSLAMSATSPAATSAPSFMPRAPWHWEPSDQEPYSYPEDQEDFTELLAIPASLTRVIRLEECLAFLGSVADPMEDTSVEAQAIEELVFIMDLIRDAFRIQEDLPRSIRSILNEEPTWGWIETILEIQGIDPDEVSEVEDDGWINGRPVL